MSSKNEQNRVIEGLRVGNGVNERIADTVAQRSAKMLQESLQENFKTVLEAKVTAALQETINLHTEETKRIAANFLEQSKIKFATNVVDTQEKHPLGALSSNLSLEGLEDFDTELSSEVGKIADKSGTITVETNTDSLVGF